jgi:hypothetical protein
MERSSSFLMIFLMVISFFFIFSYILSRIQIAGLKNESLALSNLVTKQNELQSLLYKENESLKARQAKRSVASSREEVRRQKTQDLSISGNRGFLVRDGMSTP